MQSFEFRRLRYIPFSGVDGPGSDARFGNGSFRLEFTTRGKLHGGPDQTVFPPGLQTANGEEFKEILGVAYSQAPVDGSAPLVSDCRHVHGATFCPFGVFMEEAFGGNGPPSFCNECQPIVERRSPWHSLWLHQESPLNP